MKITAVLLVITMLFSVAACGSVDIPKDVPKDTPPPIESTPEPPMKPESPALPEIELEHNQEKIEMEDVYRAFYVLLSAAVSEHGVGALDTNADGSPQLRGVLYAELIDFDNDGVPELLFLYGDETFFASAVCVVYKYSQGTVEQLGNYGLYLNHAMVSIAESQNGAAYLCYGEGDSFAWSDHYYTLVNSDWIEVLSLSYFVVDEVYDSNGDWLRDDFAWFVDGNEVSEQEFENALETYLGIVNIHLINIFDDLYETVTNVLITLENHS